MFTRAVLIVLLGFATMLSGSAGAQTTSNRVQFTASRCNVSPSPALREGKDYYCGFMTVPQTWGSSSRKTIRLAVMVVKARGKHPAPDPIVFLNGGPGYPTLQEASGDYPPFVPLNRDLIFVDQRGTGQSRPNLSCPEYGRAAVRGLKQNLAADKASSLENSALKACRTRLVKAGVDLRAYTISEDAADIAALRTALGYNKVNLYGISYGTLLALEVMRSHPSGIRSVVLDSVLPPTAGFLGGLIGSSQYAFTHVFASCAASKPCNHRYPHLRTVFLNLVKRLDRKPLTLHFYSAAAKKEVSSPLSGAYLADIVSGMLHNGLVATVPSTIWQTARGKLGPITAIVSPRFASGVNIASLGMETSVVCAADQPYPGAQAIRTAEKLLPAALRPDTSDMVAADVKQCKIWKVAPEGPVNKTAVRSSIPTLILEGEFDPTTPPPFGREVARTLDHSFDFVFPGATHGVLFDGSCPPSVLGQFVEHPTKKPDASCRAEMSEPAFQ